MTQYFGIFPLGVEVPIFIDIEGIDESGSSYTELRETNRVVKFTKLPISEAIEARVTGNRGYGIERDFVSGKTGGVKITYSVDNGDFRDFDELESEERELLIRNFGGAFHRLDESQREAALRSEFESVRLQDKLRRLSEASVLEDWVDGESNGLLIYSKETISKRPRYKERGSGFEPPLSPEERERREAEARKERLSAHAKKTSLRVIENPRPLYGEIFPLDAKSVIDPERHEYFTSIQEGIHNGEISENIGIFYLCLFVDTTPMLNSFGIDSLREAVEKEVLEGKQLNGLERELMEAISKEIIEKGVKVNSETQYFLEQYIAVD